MHDLTYALYCNMHIMPRRRSGTYTTGCARVRKIARVHRAKPLSDQNNMWEFLFDDLYVLPYYSRDQACLLIRNMLLNYGVARLRGYLTKAYRTIIGRDLPDIRDLKDMWKRHEVRAAVKRKPHLYNPTTQVSHPIAVL